MVVPEELEGAEPTLYQREKTWLWNVERDAGQGRLEGDGQIGK